MVFIKRLLILSLFIFLLSGCSNLNTDENLNTSSNDTKLNINPLTGESSESTFNNRPVSIMISNIKQSLPQYGISDADVWYETVAEGGITRIMALYSDIDKIPKTGPVRSVRDYYVDMAKPYNPIFVHFGGSPKGYEFIENRQIDNIDGIKLSQLAFIQDKKLASQKGREHSFFIDSSGIKKAIDKTGYNISKKLDTTFNFVKDSEDTFIPTDSVANSVTFSFSHYTKSMFVYDNESKKYKKFQNGSSHIDANNNRQIEVDNVIILVTSINRIANDSSGRVSVDLTSGLGYYITNGNMQNISWTKENPDSNFVFKDNNGNIIKINKGKTWINIIPKGQSVSFE